MLHAGFHGYPSCLIELMRLTYSTNSRRLDTQSTLIIVYFNLCFKIAVCMYTVYMSICLYVYVYVYICIYVHDANSGLNEFCSLHDWQLMQSLVAVVDEELLQGVELEGLHHD